MRLVPVLFLVLTAAAAQVLAGARSADAREPREPALRSQAALVLDEDSGQVLLGKNVQWQAPIASLTKLMTAMVTLDASLDPDELVTITRADVDRLRGSHSRLNVGWQVARDDLLRLALMASENRAASALARSYPGGKEAFVQAMNLKAQLLGMADTRFADVTGLSSANVSTADDLAKLARAAHRYPKIGEYSTTTVHTVKIGRHIFQFGNTNRLTRSSTWDIGLSKTGYISEAGRCLVMQVTLAGRAVIIVLLDSWGKYSRIADARRIRKWLELVSGQTAAQRSAMQGAPGSDTATQARRVGPG
ncbi:MAG: D-alanyl-D-alanine endopeptidase [Burkholderiales bacterium]